MNRSILYTNRLKLSPVAERDIEKIHALHSLEETDRYNTLGIPHDLDETKALVESWIAENRSDISKKFYFTVELISGTEFIGLIGMNLGREKYKNAEVWFKFDYRFWNRGYATECLRRLIAFGFDDLKLHRIEAGCAVENTGSARVMEKAGMQREAHTRKLLPLKSGWSDNYGYAILEEDFFKTGGS